MSDVREVLTAAAELLAAGEPFVMATVVRTQGSSPRDAGARMLWRGGRGAELPNGAIGTVGGGRLEHLVLDAARECFRKRTSGLERFVLGADADQCCGGVVEVYIEYHGRHCRAVIFGAGHVSRALHDLLRDGPMELIVVDDRAEWNSAERFPAARRLAGWDEGVAAVHERPERTLAVVMTCSHDTDLEVLRRVLGLAPAFTGLIGSESKRACFVTRLAAAGVDERSVRAVRCPVGVGDTGKEPHAVAISIAAQLLMEVKALDAQRPGNA